MGPLSSQVGHRVDVVAGKVLTLTAEIQTLGGNAAEDLAGPRHADGGDVTTFVAAAAARGLLQGKVQPFGDDLSQPLVFIGEIEGTVETVQATGCRHPSIIHLLLLTPSAAKLSPIVRILCGGYLPVNGKGLFLLDLVGPQVRITSSNRLGEKVMPELPEVETLCRQLQKVVEGLPVLGIEIFDAKLGKVESPQEGKVSRVQRHGKGIEIALDNGRAIHIHLRMTGRLLWLERSAALPPHTRFVITFPKGKLAGIDPRRFATLAVHPAAAGAKTDTLDPLKGLRVEDLLEAARRRKLPVKSFLLDQKAVGGIGNIYACEILHAASVSPLRPACDLSLPEWKKLVKETDRILRRAITCRGTTISDWRDLHGCKGENQNNLRVYGKEGEPCPVCGAIIQRIRLGGRGTYFCPGCQK